MPFAQFEVVVAVTAVRVIECRSRTSVRKPEACYQAPNTSQMPKPTRFSPDPWILVADPPPCDPGSPARALAYCEKARNGQRCTCVFSLEVLAGDLEEAGLGEHTDQFEDEIDADSLGELVDELLGEIDGLPAFRLRQELLLLRDLAAQGSGLRPADEG